MAGLGDFCEIDFAARRERLAYKSRLINNTTKLCVPSSSRPDQLRAPLLPSAAKKEAAKAQLEPDRSSTLRSSRSQRCRRRPNAHQQQATARRTDGLRSLIVAEVSRSEAPCEREARRWSERSLARPLAVRPEKGPATADLRRWSQRQLSQLQAGLAAERRAAASSATTAATSIVSAC